MTVRFDDVAITWLGYATAKIETADGPTVYTDPGRYGVLDGYDERDGDLVIVTHDHHYDPDGIDRVADEDATVVLYESIDASAIDRDVTPVDELEYDTRRVGEESHLSIETGSGRIDLWSVPAYNEPDGPCANADGTVPHPRGSGCGYLVSVDGRRIFWPGDADALPGYAALDVSVFLANIGGTVVSDASASAALTARMRPDLVVPIHYDTIETLAADAPGFAADVAGRGIPVALDE